MDGRAASGLNLALTSDKILAWGTMPIQTPKNAIRYWARMDAPFPVNFQEYLGVTAGVRFTDAWIALPRFARLPAAGISSIACFFWMSKPRLRPGTARARFAYHKNMRDGKAEET